MDKILFEPQQEVSDDYGEDEYEYTPASERKE